VTTAGEAIRFERLPARRGVQWLRSAYAMFSLARLPWLTLLALYYVILFLIDVVPLIGQIAAPVLKPVFAVGFLAAAWSQERGGTPTPKQLFVGFRSNLWALLPLGVVLVVGITLAILGTALVDDGKLLDLLSGKAKLDDAIVGDDRVQLAMLFAVACALPVMLALWFAPALVVFQDCSARQALATSFVAALANWKPIAIYGLLVFFYGGVVPTILATLVAFVAPASIVFPVALVVVLPYLAMFVATLHISDYVSYRDIFHHDEVHEGVHTAPVNPPPAAPPAA
jgi:hypothetical protein